MDKKKKKKRLTKKQRIRRRNRLFGFMGIVIVVLMVVLAVALQKEPNNNQGEHANNITATPTPTDGVTPTPTNDVTPTPTNHVTPTPSPTTDPTPTPTAEPTKTPLPTISLSGMDSSSAVLIRCIDNEVLVEKGADTKLYPASLTKIMTALIAVENIDNMNDTLVIKQSTYDSVYVQGASLAGFPTGEKLPVKDVLYGVILPSGAECCLGIAEYLFGSEEEMVKIMNAKASDLGMLSTNFVNTTGLHDSNHYTTAKDLAKLLQYALQNETFREIYCAKSYTTAPNKKSKDGLTFQNTMFARLGNKTVDNGEILGGKTGYTSKAGNCLASYAKIDGEEYILVTTGSKQANKMGAVEDALFIYNQIAPNE